MGVFKKTYSLLSTELNIPVVPIAISGAWYGDKTDKLRIKRTKITIEFLPAIHPEGLTSDQINELVRQRIKEKIAQ
jgi:long-chain acyl-CoA synthetase